jgi:hypothetical protein
MPRLPIALLILPLALLSFPQFAPPSQEGPTATPTGPYIIVPELVNVRLEPRVDSDQVGVLIAGQTAPAIGRTPGGDWIQIEYPGVQGGLAWVYSPLVLLEGGFLPIVEPPPTSTPRVTATIDPTLAAQFNLEDFQPTRLPTFTPAPPVVQATFESISTPGGGGFPPILAIFGFLIVGIFGSVISFLRGG